MPRRNRVDPWSDLHAVSTRGLLTGNRGCLVDATGQVVRHHVGSLWISCVTKLDERRQPLAVLGRWTPIFFLDDAVALAAGHRPCGYCRRDDYRSYRDAVTRALGLSSPLLATDLNHCLSRERHRRGRGIDRATDRMVSDASIDDLPAGTVIVDAERRPWLLLDDRMLLFGFDGWSTPIDRPARGGVRVLTPPTSVAALTHGYQPTLHPSALG